MDGGNVYVYDFTELREDIRSFAEQSREQYDKTSENIGTICEQNETIITDLQNISDRQTDVIVLNMLFIGLLGIIIGICFVNIFKSR